MPVTASRQGGAERIKAWQVSPRCADARAVLPRRRLQEALLDDRDAESSCRRSRNWRRNSPFAPVQARPILPNSLRDWELTTSPSGVSTSPDRRRPPPAWSANRPLPTRTSAAAPASFAADPRSKVAFPAVPRCGVVGMSLGNHIDEAADRIRPIEQCGRAPHDFDPLRGRRIDGHRVIGGLCRQVARSLPVLQNQHAIAVETTNHGSCRGGPERARRHARLVFERRANRHLEPFAQLLANQHRRRLIRLELTSRLRADRDHLVIAKLGIHPAHRWARREPPSRSLRCAGTSSRRSGPTRDMCRAARCRSGIRLPYRMSPRGAALPVIPWPPQWDRQIPNSTIGRKGYSGLEPRQQSRCRHRQEDGTHKSTQT